MTFGGGPFQKRLPFTRMVLIILIGFLILALLGARLSGCRGIFMPPKSDSDPQPGIHVPLLQSGDAPAPKSVSQIGPRAKLYTVEHDGHLFVVYYDSWQGGLSHHPDCECLKGTFGFRR